MIIDCRLEALLKEMTLPKTCKIRVENYTDKIALYNSIKELLVGRADTDHICLLGLQELPAPKSYEEADFLANDLSRS